MLLKVVIAAAALFGVLLFGRLLNRFLDEFARSKKVPYVRVLFVRKLINTLMVVLAIIVFCFVLGLGYHQVFIFLSSVLAVVGIALFAQWSILSHLTAGIIIFFAFPYRVGDRVKVLDPEDDITGEIMEVASFHVLIRRDDGSTVTYPNSALLQKPVVKLPLTAPTEEEEIAEKAPEAIEAKPQ
ncbi:mechanosensitive ion channel family protein [Spongiibacter taiwanensis]|uniref:mechanosensitive ion channel family protein n=1 Tax=Spongiibacter taiwanensis TaxID=1748242 RepID=UPI00203522E6|nr:mechanosensitive ion channel family protein [Spongiibacter taiwanensis]USA43206.1 mechanosensitive ion channel family protein [Spongiibacter taiwanensis]